MRADPEMLKWARRPLSRNACESERLSHAEFRQLLEGAGMTVSRGEFRLHRCTAALIAACLFGAGFLTSTWITALIRS